MPVTPTYPGVYIQEVPSGVRTITGVSTSVTAFVGLARRGPLNRAVRVLSFSDFERSFGGLSADSEMSYAVRQFFINGGGEALIVRLAGAFSTAEITLKNGAAANVLKVTAMDEGASGNAITLNVDYATASPTSTFNLTIAFVAPDNPADTKTEFFGNLSMNSASARFVESVVNGTSTLVKAERVAALGGLGSGVSTSGFLTNTGESGGTLLDVKDLVDDTHQQLRISVNGTAPVSVTVTDADLTAGTTTGRLLDLCNSVKSQVLALVGSNPALAGFNCAPDGANKRIVMTSGVAGEFSTVSVLPGLAKDLSTRLKLGQLNGGTETEAAATIRPAAASQSLSGGSETPVTPATEYAAYIGSRAARKGIYALESVDLFNILCLPGISDAGILADANAYCKERRAFFIIDSFKTDVTPAQMESTAGGTSLPKSENAAVYFPWINIADPLNSGKPRLVAPGGSVAGLYARTDSARGIWKAPAGTEASIAAQSTGYKLTDGENGTLNPLGVNCIRNFPVYGIVAWGARTLKGADQQASEWKYVPVRRLALYIEESLYRGTQWVVFEPNDEPLWAQIRLNVGAVMNTLFRQGAFQGRSPREAYFVKCDRETTTQDDINRGVVNILVGFAPLKPAEFVIISIQQMAGQIEA